MAVVYMHAVLLACLLNPTFVVFFKHFFLYKDYIAGFIEGLSVLLTFVTR